MRSACAGAGPGLCDRAVGMQAAEEGDAAKVDKRRKRKKAEAQDAAFIEEDNDGDYQAVRPPALTAAAAH